MYYSRYISREQYDEIVNDYERSNDYVQYPHCNPAIRHEPNGCPFCDGFYKAYPEYAHGPYTSVDPFGNDLETWGGNQAPIVSDTMAEKEDRL